jgi:hypothetical protein
VLLTIQGYPTHQLFYEEEKYKLLIDDYTVDADIVQSIEGLRNLLEDLAELLQQHGRTLTDYGFPEPLLITSLLDREYLKHGNVCEQQSLLLELQATAPNNADQEVAYRKIVQKIDNNETYKYFLQGKGGSGKITLAKKVMAYTRSKGAIALGCASTGLAASINDDFYTSHTLFAYPVEEDDDSDLSDEAVCNFDKNPGMLELLTAEKVIIWDESTCNHKKLYEAAYRALDGFKGKVLLMMRDFRQSLPVVKRETRQEVIAAAICFSYLWEEFEMLFF